MLDDGIQWRKRYLQHDITITLQLRRSTCIWAAGNRSGVIGGGSLRSGTPFIVVDQLVFVICLDFGVRVDVDVIITKN